MISFENPEYLLLAVFIPLLILIHFFSLRNRKSFAVKFANFEAIARIKGIDIYSKNIVVLSLSILIVLSLTMAASGLNVTRSASSSSFSYTIAIDSSKSMEATDILPTRMDAAKETAIDFVESVGDGTNIGVISFSGSSFIEQEVTSEKNDVINAINNIEISSIGGTDISDAIITGSNLLYGEENKAIIILSDGQLNIGDIEKATSYANRNSVTIHSVSIGTVFGGNTSYGFSKVDEDALKSISLNTKGEFYSVTSKEDLSETFREIADLRTKVIADNLVIECLVLAIILFVIQFYLINNRYRSLP